MSSVTTEPEHTVLDKPLQLLGFQRRMILSPLRLMLTIALSIFITEILIMLTLEYTEIGRKVKPSIFVETLSDASILTAVLFLILFFYLFRPLVTLVRDYHEQEHQLKTYQDHLQQLVEERTRSLEEAYSRLQDENEENRKTKQALFESEERFRQIFEHSADAIILFEPNDSSVIDLNPTAEDVFRRKKESILAGGLDELCCPDEARHLASIFRQMTQDNAPCMIDKLECAVAPGEVRVLSFRGKIIRLQGAQVIYATFRDITARIRLEQEAREIQAHLIHVNRMTTLGTMVSSVAHEINNPNNFLLMNTGILKRAWNDIAPVIEEHFQRTGDFPVAQSSWSEARSFLPDAIDGIQQGAQRISAIVDTLKSFGRDERFRSEALADVNEVVRLSASILSQQISRSTTRFRLELAEGLPRVRGSARQLEQVVINLVQNALLALPGPEQGVRVTTSAEPGSGEVLITVVDEGRGIPPEIAARIMEPFFTTRLEQGGTGLGLAISASIVKEHGGSIEFSTEPGQGSTFTVHLCRSTTSDSVPNGGEVKHADS